MTFEPVTLESLLTHQSWALRVARRLVREEGEAEELVQRTWMAALRRPPGSESGARAWIRKVILNLARERHRRNRTRERYERASFQAERSTPDALESLSRAEINHMLSERILALGEPYRSVVLLRFYENLSSVEIARQLGVPAGTVRWRLKVGLDQLRAELDRRTQGDRTRWVSALIAALPELARPAEGASKAGARPAGSASLISTLTWVGLTAAGVLGLVLLGIGSPWQSDEVHAAVADAARARSEGSPGSVLTNAAVDAPAPQRALREGTSPPSATSIQEKPAGLSIAVVDERGALIPNAQILVAHASGFEARVQSDAEGRALFQVGATDVGALGLASTVGRVSVRALAEGHVASPLVHVAPPFTPEHEVRLVVGGPDSVLRGRILDPENRAIPGAVVAWFVATSKLVRVPEGDFSSPSYLAVTTDGDGRFELAHLPLGQGNLACFAAGFATYTQFYNSADAESGLELRMERGASVSGVVRGPAGQPVACVRISCEPLYKAEEWATGLPTYVASWSGFGESTRSDERGRFQLAGLTAAGRTRTLWALDEPSGLMASLTLNLADGAEEHWDVELRENAGFRLRLVDENGQGLAGWVAHIRRPALLESSWWLRRQAADQDGRVLITDGPDAEVFLDVFPPSGVGASYAWRRLRPSAEEQLIEVETRATSSIRGRILDTLGQPDLRGKLAFHSLQTTLSTAVERADDGSFEQRLVPGGYGLVLQLDQTAARLVQLNLGPGESRDLGMLSSPAMGTLRLNGAALHNGERTPSYSIFRLAEQAGERGLLRVGRGLLEDEVLLSVFAGQYRVLSHDGAGSQARAYNLRVEPYTETRVDLEPELGR